MSDHLPEHANHTPSAERIREAHSKLGLTWFGKEKHPVYTQSVDEACYICTLLAEVAAKNAEIARLKSEVKVAEHNETVHREVFMASEGDNRRLRTALIALGGDPDA